MVKISKMRIILVSIIALTLQTGASLAQKMRQPVYPQVVDARHASDAARSFFASFFTAKSRHDVDATMQHFSPNLVTYTDATLGWPLDGYEILKATFEQYMPTWPETGLSYPTRIIGGTESAIVAFTDTPELFGGELRILGAVDMKDGTIIRWVDYWDSRNFDDALYQKMKTLEEKFPTDFKESGIAVRASKKIRSISSQLQKAFATGDAKAASGLFSYDAVYEDMALRVQLLGRAEIEHYLSRVLSKAPFGIDAKLRHILGNDLGGGFEWIGSSATKVKFGITALELDAQGKISRLTSVYDSRDLTESELQGLDYLHADK